MMDCAHYRRSVLADPKDPDPRLSEHRAGCRDCTAFTEGVLNFESRLDRALRVPLPPDRAMPLRPESPPAALRPSAYRRGRLALVVAGALWLAAPGPSLAAAVVTHMGGEPDAWLQTDPVPSSALQSVLRDSRLRLAAGAGVVSYASSCEFRGHRVPHLVIQTESGPVTVMVLVHERQPKPVQFDEQGYRGVIVPVAGHGSLAVLTRGTATDIKTVESTAARVLDSIVWTG
jgi:hypothetical protein